ncbi:MAG: aminotransferase class I/II-fold pyridoxal phosphate-dependent enzyme, partial [Candidatus Margulisiibacteriota bacterium]
MENFELKFEEATRLQALPVYVFAKLDEVKAIERAKGADLIDLGMGNPDLPVPKTVLKEIKKSLGTPAYFRYPDFSGLAEFRQAVSTWCKRQYDIDVSPDNEVIPLIGSKEGVVHLIFS